MNTRSSMPVGFTAKILLTIVLFALALAPVASAAITTVSYWRGGDNDPGVSNGGFCSSTTDPIGGRTLQFSPAIFWDSGTVVGSAAATRVGSLYGLRAYGAESGGTNAAIPSLTDNFGLELWVRPSTLAGNQCLAYNGNTGSSGWGLYLIGNQYQGLFGGVNFVGTATATANTWTHLALVRNNGTATLYVNGVAAGTLANAPISPAGRFAIMGQPQNPALDRLNGFLDEVRVFTFAPGSFSTSDLLVNRRVVSTTADAGPASLRQAITELNASGGGVITFEASLFGQTITLTSGELPLSGTVTIDASSLSSPVRLNGNHASRIFNVGGSANVTLNSLVITNGFPGTNALGGAIVNSGALTINNCTLAGNAVTNAGGAIHNSGTLTLTGCTLSGNSAFNFGGAINNNSVCTARNCTFYGNSAVVANGGAIDNAVAMLSVLQCTFVGNTTAGAGGAIDNYLGQVNVTNSIIAGNSGSAGSDIYNWSGSTIAAGGSNIVQLLVNAGGTLVGTGTMLGVNPLLAPPGNYGGPTATMPPLPGSPAIDRCTSGASFATDQRGYPRIVGAYADIGAVEAGNAIPGYNYTVVTTTNDFLNGLTNSGVSLRSALAFVANNATVTFAPALSGRTIILTNGQLTLTSNVTINASALAAGIQINGNASDRVFNIAGGSTVVLDSLTVTNGRLAIGNGGGIYNLGNLTVNRCTLAGNYANNYAGGIYSEGALTVNQCTLTRNTNGFKMGAAITMFGGVAHVNQSTVTANTALYSISGVGGISGTVTIYNSIVAGNNGFGAPNFAGTITFTGVNRTNGSPLLAPLGNYGGPTPTMPPLPGSPAIDGCTSGTNFASDQRGKPRIVGAFADIGAVEGVFNPAFPLDATKLGDGNVQFAFANLSGPSYTVLASTNVAAPLNTWSNLGAPTESPAGTFTFTDTQATNYPRRFYRVQGP